ncbi:hypothetical protein B0H14DRAFT_3521805 [Mycena olivaceomarginata]|nr:hypothetical protein B0H14DRAFT_3521805 [Mycena olivaceomarginata]
MTDVTTPDARKPDKPRDLSEALAELAAEKPQPISRPCPYVLQLAHITEEDRAKHREMMWARRRCQHHDEATCKAVAAAARKPIDYSLLASSAMSHPPESLKIATHSDNANKTDGLPALTEAEDDDNEIPELIPVIEHDSGTYIPSASYGYGPDSRKPAKGAHCPYSPYSTIGCNAIVDSCRATTAFLAAYEGVHTKEALAHRRRVRAVLAACFGTAVRCHILEDAIKLRQAIFDEATGALGTDNFVAVATGVEELWLSQWDSEASWGGGSTWDTPPVVNRGWGCSALDLEAGAGPLVDCAVFLLLELIVFRAAFIGLSLGK